VLPNITAPIIVEATMQMARAVLTEASLSYLGVGVQMPTASWGNMLMEANSIATLTLRPWQWVPPGLCILLAVLSINFIGDGLRDAFDARQKK
jgi:peptide/nickel transport system permease protein